MSDVAVIARLRAVGQQVFEQTMRGAAESIGGVDTAAQHADAQSEQLERSLGAFRQRIVTLAKRLPVAVAAAGVARVIHLSLDTTEQRARDALRVARTTGMSVNRAGEWVQAARVRSVDGEQLNRAFVVLSRQMVAAGQGSTSSLAVFKQLGVPLAAIRAGDTEQVMRDVSDGLTKARNPAQRAAYAQQLLGRGGQDLLPMLMGGAKGIDEQLAASRRYVGPIAQAARRIKQLKRQQMNLKMASDGLKIALATDLMPTLVSAIKTFERVVRAAQPFLRNTTLVRVAFIGLSVAFVAWQSVLVVSALVSLGPWLAVIAAAAALVGVLTFLYTRFAVVRTVVHATARATLAVVTWIKDHTGLLVAAFAPWAGVARLVVQRRDTLLHAVQAAWDDVKAFGAGIAHAFNTLTRLPHAVLDALRSLLPTFAGAKNVGRAIAGYATGGLVPHTGWGVVGERGPELVNAPGAAGVSTIVDRHGPAPSIDPHDALWAMHGGQRDVIAELYTGPHLIGTATATAAS